MLERHPVRQWLDVVPLSQYSCNGKILIGSGDDQKSRNKKSNQEEEIHRSVRTRFLGVGRTGEWGSPVYKLKTSPLELKHYGLFETQRNCETACCQGSGAMGEDGAEPRVLGGHLVLMPMRPSRIPAAIRIQPGRSPHRVLSWHAQGTASATQDKSTSDRWPAFCDPPIL